MPETWRTPLEQEARENDFPVNSPDELERSFMAFIAKIEGINVSSHCEYQFLNLQEVITGGGDERRISCRIPIA